MKLPCKGRFRVTSIFGKRGNMTHLALDGVLDDDKTVLAVIGGKVLQSRIVNGGKGTGTAEWGNYVSVAGDDGNTHYYCHLASRAVNAGQRVEAGQALGVMGSTGKSTGPHLHYEVRNSAGVSINPASILGIPNQVGIYTSNTNTKENITGDDELKMGIYAPTDKTVSSQLLKEGAFAIMQSDGLKLYERRMVREIDDNSLSPQFEAMKAEMQNGELIIVTEN